MPRPATKAGSLIAALATAWLLLSCDDDGAPVAYLEIGAESRIESLEVWLKRYQSDGGSVITRLDPLQIALEREGYVVGDRGSPLRLSIDFPEPGRYAVHLVGAPLLGEALPDGPPAREGDLLIETRCITVEGEIVDRGGVLATLRREHDDDGDTFPADEGWCTDRSDRGIPCDDRCAAPEFAALLDCNYVSGPPLGPECGEIPSDAEFHPFAVDGCADCFDQDCYAGDAPCQDRDGDGFPLGEDCDDDDDAIHPGADELCGNGIDDNCTVDAVGCDDGDLPCDSDGDGFIALTSPTCGDDCDDTNRNAHPAALEGCGMDPEDLDSCPGCGDLIDNDCDERVDELCQPADDDIDDDGVTFDLDCDDCNAGVGLGRIEVCGNGLDEDCDGADLPCAAEDRDGDGFSDGELGGSDCDDSDPRTFPEAPDRCGDDVAQNCAGDVDCDSIEDMDGDGFAATVDCNDSEASMNPWEPEVCDSAGLDENCDGVINEVPGEEAGLFGCGFDSAAESWVPISYSGDPNHCGGCRQACCRGLAYCAGNSCVEGVCVCAGATSCAGDVTDFCCDDGCRDLGSDRANCGRCGQRCARNELCRPNPDRHGLGDCLCESVGEACPSEDWSACCPTGCVDLWEDLSNCGRCGNDCASTRQGNLCALDTDGEARCFCGRIGVVCGGDTWCTELTEPEGRTCGCADLENDPANCGACGHACAVNEICFDRTCGCFDATGSPDRCSDEEVCCAGYGCVNTDTDVGNCGGCGSECAAGEVCADGVCACASDDACDDSNPCTVDRCDASRHCVYSTRDDDDDGYCAPGCSDSEPSTPRGECEDSPGDCDDSRADIHPGATETCDTAHDDNCDGDDNEVGALSCSNFHYDRDDDTYGTDDTRCTCRGSGHYTATRPGDCDDDNGGINPGVRENCATGVDDNCDGHTDERDAIGCTNFYRDADRDTWGTNSSECHCTGSHPFTATRRNDCDDGRSDVNPGASERCATPYDDDCDGSSNDLDATGCTTFFHDGDDDGYGSPVTQCLCRVEGNYRATEGGDCNDGRADMSPGLPDLCNDFNDDCDLGTANGSGECARFCCGGACQECCVDRQCPGIGECDIGGSWTCSDIPPH